MESESYAHKSRQTKLQCVPGTTVRPLVWQVDYPGLVEAISVSSHWRWFKSVLAKSTRKNRAKQSLFVDCISQYSFSEQKFNCVLLVSFLTQGSFLNKDTAAECKYKPFQVYGLKSNLYSHIWTVFDRLSETRILSPVHNLNVDTVRVKRPVTTWHICNQFTLVLSVNDHVLKQSIFTPSYCWILSASGVSILSWLTEATPKFPVTFRLQVECSTQKARIRREQCPTVRSSHNRPYGGLYDSTNQYTSVKFIRQSYMCSQTYPGCQVSPGCSGEGPRMEGILIFSLFSNWYYLCLLLLHSMRRASFFSALLYQFWTSLVARTQLIFSFAWLIDKVLTFC